MDFLEGGFCDLGFCIEAGIMTITNTIPRVPYYIYTLLYPQDPALIGFLEGGSCIWVVVLNSGPFLRSFF